MTIHITDTEAAAVALSHLTAQHIFKVKQRVYSISDIVAHYCSTGY